MTDERTRLKTASREAIRLARELATRALDLRAELGERAEADTLAQLATFAPLLLRNGSLPAGLSAAASEMVTAALELGRRRVPSIAGAKGEGDGAAHVHRIGQLLERYLHEYDARLRRQRGIYFTPAPVVGYLVRSVRQIIEQHFASAARLRVIDPACGCGAFLAESLQSFDATPSPAQPSPAQQVSLLGFEVVPATWAIAEILLRSNELASARPLTLYCASALEDDGAGERWREAILGTASEPALPVILGNPPYANFGRQNQSPWMRSLLADYKRGLAERKLNLDDDCIKFLRWGQHWIERAGGGILAMITSSTYLRGLTHRRMRESLLETFDELYCYDLHGSHGKRRGATGSDLDENIFPIQSGVAIGIFVKHSAARDLPSLSSQPTVPQVFFHESLGTRAAKLAQLQTSDVAATLWQPLRPEAPTFTFAPAVGGADEMRCSDYASFWPLDGIFCEYISGVQTKNDATFVGFTREDVAKNVRRFLGESDSEHRFAEQLLRSYLVAPFDRRWIYYDPALLGRARQSVMRHMLRPNVGLVFMRQSTNAGEYDHFLAVDCLVSDRVFYSLHGAPFLAPLWLWEETAAGDAARRENFQPDFRRALATAIGGDAFDPPAVLAYLYAVFHSPRYRAKYAHELRAGFPRVPLPLGKEPFFQLVQLGEQLLRLHLLPGQLSAGAAATAGDSCLSALSANQQADSELSIGGYAVVARWRKQRRRRTLSRDDERYLAAVNESLKQTAALVRKLDDRG
jgi:predicted helicase